MLLMLPQLVLQLVLLLQLLLLALLLLLSLLLLITLLLLLLLLLIALLLLSSLLTLMSVAPHASQALLSAFLNARRFTARRWESTQSHRAAGTATCDRRVRQSKNQDRALSHMIAQQPNAAQSSHDISQDGQVARADAPRTHIPPVARRSSV